MLEDFRLKIFMAVAAERSFTKAAISLGISQPAVSQNISELEKEVGLKLFERLRGEVAITPQGLVFQRHAEKVLDSYESLNMVFCNPRIKSRTIPVRLFISPLPAGMLLPALIDALAILQPGLPVELVDSADAAHVSIDVSLDRLSGSGLDLSFHLTVSSNDPLLAAFFRQLTQYCL